MLSHHLVPRRLVGRPAARARGEIDRLFDDLWSGFAVARPEAFTPRIDVREDEDAIRVRAELPGLEQKDFELTVEGDLLTLKGEKRDEHEEKSRGYSRMESRRGSFQRAFRLPWEVDPDTVEAVYKNGILEVTVPKPAEKASPVRSIPVTAE